MAYCQGLASKLREYEDRQEIEEEPVERLPSRSNFFSTEEENELASQGFQGYVNVLLTMSTFSPSDSCGRVVLLTVNWVCRLSEEREGGHRHLPMIGWKKSHQHQEKILNLQRPRGVVCGKWGRSQLQ